MYLMYVDESGDPGHNVNITKYFILSSIVVHEQDWQLFIDRLVQFRRVLRDSYGLPLRAEIHAVEYLRKQVFNIPKYERLALMRNFIDELAKMPIAITSVVINKQEFLRRRMFAEGDDIFITAWKYLFQRFENTLGWGNFPRSQTSDKGIAITDNTDGGKLIKLVRKMSVYNPVPNVGGRGFRPLPIQRVIEDPHFKDSVMSLPIQACDVCAYFLMQYYNPNKYVKSKGADKYYFRLAPVLNNNASRTNKFGIVEYP
ncbi:DUF3800 domain-containing protein [Emcibacter sp.]|uniref:DUF3800 domain-containing protein n=1 Tax=Emcibacter sp. TaxID=1979954 RepID=UPI002AA84E47|nr:DUF3800 domain-containing protein [Emcibacter sp.]